MNLHKLVSDMVKRGISLRLDGDKVNCHASKGVINSQDIQALKENKTRLISLLQEVSRYEQQPVAAGAETGEISQAQQRIWQLQQNHLKSSFLLKSSLRLRGRLDPDRITLSIQKVVARHENLRATFQLDDNGKVYQRIKPEMSIDVHVIESNEENLSDANCKDLIESHSLEFCLETGPAFRVLLINGANEASVLTFMCHQIIFDAGSIDTFLNEVEHCYSNQDALLEEFPYQYLDFCQWQSAQTCLPLYAEQYRYWRSKFSRPVKNFALPGRVEEKGQSVTSFSALSVTLPDTTESDIACFCRDFKVTDYMVFMLVFRLSIYRMTGQTSIPVFTTSTQQDASYFNGLIGLFANPLLLTHEMTESDSMAEVLAQEKQISLNGFANNNVPFSEVLEFVNWDLSECKNVFQTQFIYNVQQERDSFLNLPLSNNIEFENLSVFDWQFNVAKRGRFELKLQFNGYKYDQKTVERFLQYYQRTLTTLLTTPHNTLKSLQPEKLQSAADSAESNESKVLPETDVQRRLHTIWKKVLGHSDFGIEDDFLTIGGYSLLAIRMFREVKKEFGIDPRAEYAVVTIRNIESVVREQSH